MSEHAILSASSAHRWIPCPGSIALCKDIPKTSSKYADHGKAMHERAAQILLGHYVSTEYEYDGKYIKLDDDDKAHVRSYADFVRDYAKDGTLLVEQRVDYSEAIDVADSFGTADAVILSADGFEITIIDLKGGKGVQVDADHNPQLMLYALGSLNEYSMLGDWQSVRLVIHQPRIDHISEWTCSVNELREFAEETKTSAKAAMNSYYGQTQPFLNPGGEQCRFCPAKAICPALSDKVTETIECAFEDLNAVPEVTTIIDELSVKMKAVPMIEAWCKGVRAKVESELLSNNPVNGFKLVRGKQGNRQWIDEAAIESELKAMRLKQSEIYDMSVISPTKAEKLLKDNPRLWKRLEPMIIRKEGAMSVAPEDDKRPALVVTDALAGFESLGEEESA